MFQSAKLKCPHSRSHRPI